MQEEMGSWTPNIILDIVGGDRANLTFPWFHSEHITLTLSTEVSEVWSWTPTARSYKAAEPFSFLTTCARTTERRQTSGWRVSSGWSPGTSPSRSVCTGASPDLKVSPSSVELSAGFGLSNDAQTQTISMSLLPALSNHTWRTSWKPTPCSNGTSTFPQAIRSRPQGSSFRRSRRSQRRAWWRSSGRQWSVLSSSGSSSQPSSTLTSTMSSGSSRCSQCWWPSSAWVMGFTAPTWTPSPWSTWSRALFVSSSKTDVNEKATDALTRLGYPILQGALLSLSGSYIFRTFFKIVFLVIKYGLIHSLVFIPGFFFTLLGACWRLCES